MSEPDIPNPGDLSVTVPPAIVTSNLSDDPRDGTSPQDSELLSRKFERQGQVSARPNHLANMTSVASPDSPGLHSRLASIQAGNDPTQNSSPVGTGLMKAKMAREAKAAQESQFSLPESAASSAEAPPALDR